jgi:hypothetical protein
LPTAPASRSAIIPVSDTGCGRGLPNPKKSSAPPSGASAGNVFRLNPSGRQRKPYDHSAIVSPPIKKGQLMTIYSTEQLTDQPDRIYVEVDRRFNVVIERTEDGLALHVYPRTNGELWDTPFTTFEVAEAEIAALEQQMEE